MRVPSSDGVDLAAYDLGGDGPPLLIAHATGFLAAVYRPLAEHLAGRFHSWAFDFRAHGASTRPGSGRLDWDGMADDVLATVDALGLDRPVAVGHSMGGAALVLAEQRRPGTFAGLYLYEPVLVPVGAFPPSDGDDNPMSAAARRRRPVFESRDAAYANYASKPPLNILTPEALRLYVEEGFVDAEGGVALRCRPDDEAEVFRMGGLNRGFDHLGELALPVTVAQGGAADPGPGFLAPRQAEAIPGGRLVVAEGLGHFGPVQDPALVATQVIEALGS